MGVRTITDRRGGPAMKADALIGVDAYETVRSVAVNIAVIKHVSANMKELFEIDQNIEGLKGIIEYLNSLLILIENLETITAVSENVDEILAVYNALGVIEVITQNLTLLESLDENKETIVEVGAALPEIMAVHGNLPSLLDLNSNTPAIIAAAQQANSAKEAAEAAAAVAASNANAQIAPNVALAVAAREAAETAAQTAAEDANALIAPNVAASAASAGLALGYANAAQASATSAADILTQINMAAMDAKVYYAPLIADAAQLGFDNTVNGDFFYAIGDDVNYLSLRYRGNTGHVERARLPKTSFLDSKADRFISAVTIQSGGGTANAQTVPLPAGMTEYALGQLFDWLPNATNTGPMTINIGGLGDIPVRLSSATAIEAGDIYNGGIFRIRISGAPGDFSARLVGVVRSRLLNSSALTGNPTAPTVAASFDTTNIASTAFVRGYFPTLAGSGGSTNAQVAVAPANWTSIPLGNPFLWFPNFTNTGAMTLDFGFGAFPVRKSPTQAVEARDLISGEGYLCRLSTDGSPYVRVVCLVRSQILNSPAFTGTPTVPTPSPTLMTDQAVNARYVRGREHMGDLENLYPNFLDAFGIPLNNAMTREIRSDGTPMAVLPPNSSAYWHANSIPRAQIPGNSFSCGVTIYQANAGDRVLFIQRDAAGAEIADTRITYQTTTAQAAEINAGNPRIYETLDYPISPSCALVLCYFEANVAATVPFKFGMMWLNSKLKKFSAPTIITDSIKAVYLSPTGEDTADGSVNTPKKTMTAALATNTKQVILLDGLYSGADMRFSLASLSGVDVVAQQSANPIVRGEGIARVTGFVPTPGRTNVYQAALSAQPHANTSLLHGLSIPFSEITPVDRRPQHRGRSHRCPHWPIKPAASLDILETHASNDPAWFWSAGVLYINAIPGVDPMTTIVVVPAQGAAGNAISGGHRGAKIGIHGITWEFQNLLMDRVARYDLEGVSIHGGPFDALSVDYCDGVDRYCTVTSAGNDNWNGHGVSSTTRRQDGYSNISYRNHSIEPYAACAWDDNRSFHESAAGRVDGGLYELGGSTGTAPAQGCEETYSGLVMRNNGWRGELPSNHSSYVGDAGGLSMVNSVGDDGNGCSVTCINVTVEGGPRGFATWVGASHQLRLMDTVTRNCGVALFASSGSRIYHDNHRDSGSLTQKFTQSGGQIISLNSERVD